MSADTETKTKLSSLQLRTISSLFIVPIFVGSIYFGGMVFFALLSVLIFISLDEWFKMAKKGSSKKKDYVVGSFYILIGLATLFLLRFLHVDGLYLTFTLLFMIWGCDTGAYFSGKTIGGKKLCPSISPGKTWAGLIGGVVTSIIVAVLAHIYWGLFSSTIVAILIGTVIAVSGQIGDLIISKYKRRVGVKDTGHIIPGHGGVLDRVDSLLLAAPVYLLVISYLHSAV